MSASYLGGVISKPLNRIAKSLEKLVELHEADRQLEARERRVLEREMSCDVPGDTYRS